MNGANLALKIGSLVLGTGIFLILFKTIKGVKEHGLATFLYIISVSLCLSLPAFLLFLKESFSETALLIFTQLLIFMAGILHIRLSDKVLPWHAKIDFPGQLLFTVCILIFAYFFSNVIFTFLVYSQVEFVWHLSLIWMLPPVFLNQAIEKVLQLPQKEYKKWQYPVNAFIEDPTDEEMANPVVISFVFQKNAGLEDRTIFRAKAPTGMALGRLFYFFINDYNGRHSENAISFFNQNNEPEQWVFFKKKGFFQKKEAMDPDETINNNHIRENNVVLCHRVSVNQKTLQNETA